jgi:Domain of unknown function (DUF4145)
MNTKKMKCPYCNLQISLEETHIKTWELYDDIETPIYGVSCGNCSACEELIVMFVKGELYLEDLGLMTRAYKETYSEIIYPKFPVKNLEPEVPDRYKKDFIEASKVLSVSPKASAALSRRILQDVFREELGISKPNLAQEIDEFIKKKDVPTYLTDAVDAVRNIGNFAAHPLKDTNTGEIVEVEAGEAEWLLEVNESLFDFVFVQPKRLAERKKNLNAKLKSIGKPPMKK